MAASSSGSTVRRPRDTARRDGAAPSPWRWPIRAAGRVAEPVGAGRGGFFQWVDGAPADGYRSPRREGAVDLSVAAAGAQPGHPPHSCVPHQHPLLVRNAGSEKAEVALLTGEYGARVLDPVLPALAEAAGGPVRALPVPNRLFGGNIAVTGLLAGADVAAVLETEPPSGVRYLLPDVTISRGVFLDGSAPGDLPRPVEIIGTGGDALVEALRQLTDIRYVARAT